VAVGAGRPQDSLQRVRRKVRRTRAIVSATAPANSALTSATLLPLAAQVQEDEDASAHKRCRRLDGSQGGG
jgi:hypothetical protein